MSDFIITMLAIFGAVSLLIVSAAFANHVYTLLQLAASCH